MDELIKNLMNTPENTNPNVLRGQLQKLAGSDGNSNSKLTRNGALANLFSADDFDSDALFEKILVGGASVVLSFSFQGANFSGPIFAERGFFSFQKSNVLYASGASEIQDVQIDWDQTESAAAKMLRSGQIVDMGAYLSQIQGTLTIYYHPMPDVAGFE